LHSAQKARYNALNMSSVTTKPDYAAKARRTDKAGDWAYARAQYESGIALLSDIALDIGVAVSTVANRASRGGWVRDQHARLRITEERKALEAAEWRTQQQAATAQVERVTAIMQSKVVVAHRTDIARARKIANALLLELDTLTTDQAVFANLGDLLNAPDDRGIDKLNQAYRKVISLPERSATLNSLGAALKTLIQLERQAFDINGPLEDPDQPRPPEQVTKGLADIMHKFDSVLALQAPPAATPATTPMADVVDVPPTH